MGNKAVVIFNKLDVTNIDNNSGIFIGNNYANGWNTFMKTNNGFGHSGDHSIISYNRSAVIDNDMIDAPMTNYSMMVDRRQYERNHTFVHLDSIEVNNMDMNSSVSVGETNQNEWGNFEKNNFGNGRFVGNSIIPNNKSIIKDNDIVDNPVEDYEHFAPAGSTF
ncbi:hypothetical protein [Ferviditalea candida]|uniref:Right handed beta helix domain-containing protein n=1 Tax=Ferviditalea candida TaxID=3108399 RepID=A0ABU5ZEZ6_9BACL|nr:hypothetical protein [Paenibacillaceae bacterium T2]